MSPGSSEHLSNKTHFPEIKNGFPIILKSPKATLLVSKTLDVFVLNYISTQNIWQFLTVMMTAQNVVLSESSLLHLWHQLPEDLGAVEVHCYYINYCFSNTVCKSQCPISTRFVCLLFPAGDHRISTTQAWEEHGRNMGGTWKEHGRNMGGNGSHFRLAPFYKTRYILPPQWQWWQEGYTTLIYNFITW